MTVLEEREATAHDDTVADSEREQTSLLRRIATSGGWSIAAHGSNAAAAFFISIVVARGLGPSAFGQYSYFLWILRLVPTLLAVGIPSAIIKLVAERLGAGADGSARSLYRFGLRIHLALLPVPMAGVFWYSYGKHSHVLLALAMALGVAVGLLSLDLEALLGAVRRFHVLGVATVIVSAAQVGLTVMCAATHATWPTYVLVQSVTTAVGVAIYFWWARNEHRGARVKLPRREQTEFLRFAGIMSFTVLLNEVIWGRPEIFFLAHYHSKTTLGLYSAALRLSSVAVIVPLVAGRALLPEFARLRGAGNHQELGDCFPRVCRLMMIVTAPLALGGAAVAGPLTHAVYGSRFSGASAATAIFLAGSMVNALAAIATAVVLTGPRPRLIAELGSIVAVTNIALDFVLVPRYGIIAAALINVGMQTISVLCGIVYATARLKLHYPVRAATRIALVAATSAGLAGWSCRAVPGWPGLLLAFVVGASTYVLLLAKTGTVTADEIRVLAARR